MKIRRLISVFLLTVLIVSLCPIPRAYALADPDVDAKAALLIDETNGQRMLYGKNEHTKSYPASITKVMTALLTLEAVDRGELRLDQPITASQTALSNLDADGSSAGVEVGEVLTVEQLLYCLLVISANETANILAEAVSGSISAFVDLMNQRAAELGCTDTHFANPNGLHDPNHYTTAWDIYLFTREAMKNETFMTIVGSKSYDVPATNLSDARELHSTNALISNWRVLGYLYDGAEGIKTGSTDEAGYCLVSTAVRGGRRLIAVVLGCGRRTIGGEEKTMSFVDSATLYDWGYDNFSLQTVLEDTDLIQEVPVALSKEASSVLVHPAQQTSVLLPNDVSADQLERKVTLVNETAMAPIQAGDELGTLTLSYDGVDYVTVPLLAANDVSSNTFLVARHAISQFFARGVVKIGIVVVLLLAALFVYWLKVLRPQRRYGSARSKRRAHSAYRGRRRR